MTKTAPPAISIHNATLHYGKQLLFKQLNCELPAGKTTCLLGPSGVGKTTLLRLVAGFTQTQIQTQQAGTITTSDNQPLTQRIAYMAQTDLLLPWLSTLQNVLLGTRLRGTSRVHYQQSLARARKLLVHVGLQDAENKRPAQLSGGMRQRAALARTLMEDRPVVLMDEPFSALDTITRLRLQELTATLLQDRTVLLITHDPLEALRIGHHILIMTGAPATLETFSALSGTPPRALTDTNLLYAQGQLLQRLEQDSKVSVSC